MNDSTARAVANVACAAACAAIGWADPSYGIMAIVGVVVSTLVIWRDV
jgi:hypothetical protein